MVYRLGWYQVRVQNNTTKNIALGGFEKFTHKDVHKGGYASDYVIRPGHSDWYVVKSTNEESIEGGLQYRESPEGGELGTEVVEGGLNGMRFVALRIKLDPYVDVSIYPESAGTVQQGPQVSPAICPLYTFHINDI